jgi:medium-chain acyl-[acyl-carrier-protein] hydrolase
VRISGVRAPHVPPRERIGDKDDDEPLARLNANGGLRPELLEYPDFVKDLMDGIRKNLVHADDYLVPDLPVLTVPLHVFGGTGDGVTPASDVPAWERCAGAGLGVTLLPGDHSYPTGEAGRIVAAVPELADRRAVTAGQVWS